MKQFLALVVLSGLLYTCFGAEENQRNIGIFNVVKFKNDACASSDGGKNGTCYTEEECEEKGGVGKGSCAEGYGVCCVFTLACGGSRAENMTYFESNSQSAFGACNAKICKCNTKVCQLRLDFLTFVIAGPDTATDSSFLSLGGLASSESAGTAKYTQYGQCLSDSFAVTSVGNKGTPTICGTNTGYHMYVDASDDCNTLSFHLADGSVSVTRQWEIRVTQYNCDSMEKAPEGCLQYFYGSSTGTLETFNRANKIHLANQDQLICIRREEGMCSICYSHATDDFHVSIGGTAGSSSGVVGKSSACCNLIALDTGGAEYDCVVIPMPLKTAAAEITRTVAATKPQIPNGHFCGGFLATVTTTTATETKTICSKVTPFQIRFISDGGEDEETGEVTAKGNEGFKLHYEQLRC